MGNGAEELLHTYTEDGGINYLAAAAMLPSRSVIDDACAEFAENRWWIRAICRK